MDDYSIIFDKRLSIAARIAYCVLRKWRDEGKYCPQLSDILEELGVRDPNVVRKAIKELVKVGLVKVRHRSRKTNLYTVYDSPEGELKKPIPVRDDGTRIPISTDGTRNPLDSSYYYNNQSNNRIMDIPNKNIDSIKREESKGKPFPLLEKEKLVPKKRMSRKLVFDSENYKRVSKDKKYLHIFLNSFLETINQLPEVREQGWRICTNPTVFKALSGVFEETQLAPDHYLNYVISEAEAEAGQGSGHFVLALGTLMHLKEFLHPYEKSDPVKALEIRCPLCHHLVYKGDEICGYCKGWKNGEWLSKREIEKRLSNLSLKEEYYT